VADERRQQSEHTCGAACPCRHWLMTSVLCLQQAGMFNDKSTAAERQAVLQALLRRGAQDAAGSPHTLEELNRLLARCGIVPQMWCRKASAAGSPAEAHVLKTCLLPTESFKASKLHTLGHLVCIHISVHHRKCTCLGRSGDVCMAILSRQPSLNVFW
jgi:hypothetical protein